MAACAQKDVCAAGHRARADMVSPRNLDPCMPRLRRSLLVQLPLNSHGCTCPTPAPQAAAFMILHLRLVPCFCWHLFAHCAVDVCLSARGGGGGGGAAMERMPSNGSARSSPSVASGSVVEKNGDRNSPLGVQGWGGTIRNLVGDCYLLGFQGWSGAIKSMLVCSIQSCSLHPAGSHFCSTFLLLHFYTPQLALFISQAAISVRTGDEPILERSFPSGSLAGDQYSEYSASTEFAAGGGGGGGGQGNSVRALLS
eukprot:scaffold3161_cov21-Tisochrysis_lutea.AAC.6